jgi:hypothetical protein
MVAAGAFQFAFTGHGLSAEIKLTKNGKEHAFITHKNQNVLRDNSVATAAALLTGADVAQANKKSRGFCTGVDAPPTSRFACFYAHRLLCIIAVFNTQEPPSCHHHSFR